MTEYLTLPWVHLESYAYWTVLAASFLGVAVWESFRPNRDLLTPAGSRWGRHGFLMVICTVLSVGLYRASPVFMALAFAGNRFGLLNRAWLPLGIRLVLGVLLLDLMRYATHRAYHSVAFLWKVHQVHHSDPDFDVSTSLRVHPIEVILNQGSYLAAVALLAPPVLAVLIAELLSCFQSFFDHANASLPVWADKPLRRVLVTPDMHRIHHSEEIVEQYKNLGDIFPWWDHLFRTYLEEPAAGQSGMVPGLKGLQNDGSLRLAFMLKLPFLPEPRAEAQAVLLAAASQNQKSAGQQSQRA